MRISLPLHVLCWLWLITNAAPCIHAAPRSESIPPINFHAPPSYEPLVTRLRNLSPTRIQRMTTLIGGGTDQAPIRTIIVGEDSPLAQQVPPWIVGYAQGSAGRIVLLPDRVRSYPYGSFELVFLHEIAHVLIARASKGKPVPRWFNEGLAMASSDPWDLEDQARLIWTMLAKEQTSFEAVDSLFHQDADSAKQAYVLAGAFVRYIIAQQGPDTPGRILSHIAQGRTFPQAFLQVMSRSVGQAEADFFTQQSLWNRWAPLITSGATLWVGMIMLVLIAFAVQRRRAKAIKQQWDEEDRDSF